MPKKMPKPSKRESRFIESYTEIDDNGNVVLKIGCQSFLLDSVYDEPQWLRWMLAKAMIALADKESTNEST